MAKAKDSSALEKSSPRAKKKLSAEAFAGVLKEIKDEFTQTKGADPIALLHKAHITSPLIFVGSEQIRIRRMVSWLRENLFKISNNSNPVVSYFGSELTTTTSIENIINSLKNQSLFSRTQLIVVYEADKIKATLAKPLVDILEKGTPGILFVASVSSLQTKNAFNSLAGIGTIVTVDELKGATLKRWIAKEVKLCGGNGGITPDALDKIVETCGDDLLALSQEIAKLCLLVGYNDKITLSLVQEVLSHSPERTSFDLLKAIARKNNRRSVSLAKELLEQGLHPLQLSNFLSRAVRTMLANKGNRNSTDSFGKSATKLHNDLANPWFVKNLQPAIQAFSKEELRRTLDLLKSLDLELKSSRIPGELAVSLFVDHASRRYFPNSKLAAFA